MTLIIVIGIILAIAIYEDQNKRKKPVETRKIIGYDTQTGIPLYEGEKVTGYNTQTGMPIIEGREEPQVEVKPPKDPIDKTKISNSVLMIIGAALVVFATVVFLTSSWDDIPNIIKPFILVFIQGVFYASYKICNNKLDIPKTGKVFKYLSLLFIPIVLISLSCFELIGDELSIGGEYASLYFMASFVVSAISYKLYAKQTEDIVIKIFSYFLEILAIISLSIFIDTEYILCILLSIYTTIVYILLHGNYLDRKAYNIVNIIFIILTMTGAKVGAINENIIWYYLPFIIYTVLFFAMYVLKSDEEEQRECLYLFFINYVLSLSFISTLDVPKSLLYLICIIPLLLFAKFTKKETIKKTLQWLIFGFTILVSLSNIINPNHSYFDTLTYLTGFLIFLMLLLFFPKNKPAFKIAAYAAFTIMLVDLCFQLELDHLAKYVLILTSVLVYLVEKAFPSLQDSSSKHIIPIMLSIESIILGFATLEEEAEYTVIIPLLLMIIYSKMEPKIEDYLMVPTLCSLSLFTKEATTINVLLCSSLVLVYSILSAVKEKINIYTFISFLAIIIGLEMLGASGYIVFLALGIWSILHFMTNKEKRELFILTSIISVLGLYIKGISDLDVHYISVYFLGIFMALIATSKLVFNQESKELPLFEGISFAILTVLSLIMINEPVDAILMIIIFFIISLFTFINKYKTLLYFSLGAMIVHIIKQTLEFWASIPIYIYVLIIGLTLILFAMFDERLNIKKKNKQEEPKVVEEPKNEEKKDNIE